MALLCGHKAYQEPRKEHLCDSCVSIQVLRHSAPRKGKNSLGLREQKVSDDRSKDPGAEKYESGLSAKVTCIAIDHIGYALTNVSEWTGHLTR